MKKETAHAKFITTALKPKDYPQIRNQSGLLLPEVAVVGRSNVGKSSLLNHLFDTKYLVKTSSTPGKTQAINFFTYHDEMAFADLPGYGYAKVPLSVKKQWGPMIQTYLEKRDTLKLILLLLDIRRIPNAEDLQLMDWIAFHQKALVIVLTKIDKVTKREKQVNTEKILTEFDAANLHHTAYSVPKNLGRRELWALIREAIKDESE